MNNAIVQAECVVLEKLEHLFIDLTYEKVTTRGFNVYRSRSFNQKNKKYLQYDEIKDALMSVNKNDLKYIYLVGSNIMSHPEFNHILRLCLSCCSVTIYSNGTCINDKKARFLKRVEEEGCHEIVFKVFVNHFDEKTNDISSGRGSFRKALHAVTALNKYGFNPIFVINNEVELYDEIKEGFVLLGKKFGFETDELNFTLIPTEKSVTTNIQYDCTNEFDCKNSRVLAKTGVYNCCSLLNDYRARAGATLKDFSKKCYLETEKCEICKLHAQKMYVNNWC